MNTAAVSLYRDEDGSHSIGVRLPSRPDHEAIIRLERLPGGGTPIIHWADYHLNRPPTPIEELVDQFQSAVYEDTVNRSVFSHAKGTVEEDKRALLAAIQQIIAQREHWKANHDEMVARNQVLRRRPDLPQDCGHPKQCIGRVHEEDESEEPHCLWCGDIKDMEMLVRHCSTIYSYVTDGHISKPNTLPEEVQRVADDLETERTQAALADAQGEGEVYDELKDQVHAVADWLWQGLASTPQEAASRLYALIGVTGDGAARLQSVDERYQREVKLIQHLDTLGVLRIQRGLLAAELAHAEKAIGKAA